MGIPEIRMEDYRYGLTPERIAKYPLPQRDASKLLHYVVGHVDESVFRELPSLIPADSLMVFNDTKVVPARLHFQRSSGARIEIFCLEPVDPSDYAIAFAQTQSCAWKCVIGNAKRWKEDILSLCNPGDDPVVEAMGLTAELRSREDRTGIVSFSWKDGAPFSRVLEVCGTIPIPPYLSRESEEIDKERYQTLYARIRGSVAAPTAGLHFTDEVLDALKAKGVSLERVCLHVGAGTFLPVKSASISGHPMHREPFSVSRDFLSRLIGRKGPVVAVGTTSVRTLESLYYVGVSCIEKGKPSEVGQWDPYLRDYPWTVDEALQAIVDYLDREGLDRLQTGTRIIIVPGFSFRLVDKMVTNFHQSESTLLLLVSAFVGGDWRTIYDYALTHGFRFLSYGDSSLLERA